MLIYTNNLYQYFAEQSDYKEYKKILKEDKELVVNALKKMTDEGIYPEEL